jgi:diguanylate cyclase (GGDEF)-like protein
MAGTQGLSVLLNHTTGWELYAGDASTADELLARAAVADEVMTGGATTLAGHDTAIPLRAVGETIGLLVVRRPRHDFEPDTLHALEAAAALLAVVIKNLQLFRELHETNLRDPLTGCSSRSHGLEVIDSEVRRARRSQQPISLVLVDVDHLKDINSRYGYMCGDAVLAMVGRRLREVLRRSDLKCRYGGEEFVVLLPETSLIGARRVAETLRREIAERPMPWNGDAITVTASLGVTQVLTGEVNADAIIARAAAAACRAQEEGHNTVRVASDSLASVQRGKRTDTP